MPNVVALVTARGGSKGIPRKNVRLVAGKPLIAWTIEAARQARLLSRVILSTDCPEIAEVARTWGAEVPFLRPSELAQDRSTHVDVLRHAIDWLTNTDGYQPDYIVTLQPTSPLRLPEDIDGAVRLAVTRQADAVIGICEALSHPFRIKAMDDQQVLKEFFPAKPDSLLRQAWPTAFWTNGALYVNRVQAFTASLTMFPEGMLGYEMPVSRSLDIDTDWDLKLADLILRERTDEAEHGPQLWEPAHARHAA